VAADALVKGPESYSFVNEMLETQKVFSVVKLACRISIPEGPSCTALETDEKASGPRTREKVRAEAAGASTSLPTPRSARPYSAAEDEVLQKLVASGLAWDEIEKEFGLLFAKRTSRSLQMRWSRNLNLTVPSTRSSKRKRSSR
jgi:hypothetical protein